MNHTEGSRKNNSSLLITLLVISMLILLGGLDQAQAQSQWTSNGNDIDYTYSGNVGIGTTTPVFDGNTSKYLTVAGGSGVFGSFGVGGNITNSIGVVGQMAFINTNLSGTEKRIATIVGQNDGATNSGVLNFYTASGGRFFPPPNT